MRKDFSSKHCIYIDVPIDLPLWGVLCNFFHLKKKLFFINFAVCTKKFFLSEHFFHISTCTDTMEFQVC